MRIIDHAHARDCMIKSVAEIYKGEKHLPQTGNSIFWCCLLINQPLASLYFDKLLKYNIHSKLTL